MSLAPSLPGRIGAVPGNLSARLNADVDLGVAIPSYVFAAPVLGGQAASPCWCHSAVMGFGRRNADGLGRLDPTCPAGVSVTSQRPAPKPRCVGFRHSQLDDLHHPGICLSGRKSRIADLGDGHGAVDVAAASLFQSADRP